MINITCVAINARANTGCSANGKHEHDRNRFPAPLILSLAFYTRFPQTDVYLRSVLRGKEKSRVLRNPLCTWRSSTS
jgi:hypothetical protein